MTGEVGEECLGIGLEMEEGCMEGAGAVIHFWRRRRSLTSLLLGVEVGVVGVKEELDSSKFWNGGWR
jgi:hypothetical protein